MPAPHPDGFLLYRIVSNPQRASVRKARRRFELDRITRWCRRSTEKPISLRQHLTFRRCFATHAVKRGRRRLHRLPDVVTGRFAPQYRLARPSVLITRFFPSIRLPDEVGSQKPAHWLFCQWHASVAYGADSLPLDEPPRRKMYHGGFSACGDGLNQQVLLHQRSLRARRRYMENQAPFQLLAPLFRAPFRPALLPD